MSPAGLALTRRRHRRPFGPVEGVALGWCTFWSMNFLRDSWDLMQGVVKHDWRLIWIHGGAVVLLTAAWALWGRHQWGILWDWWRSEL